MGRSVIAVRRRTSGGPALRRRALRRRALRWLALAVLALVGAGLGAALAPSAHERVGPLDVAVAVRPSLHPGVAVSLPPVGAVRFDTHRAPFVWRATVFR